MIERGICDSCGRADDLLERGSLWLCHLCLGADTIQGVVEGVKMSFRRLAKEMLTGLAKRLQQPPSEREPLPPPTQDVPVYLEERPFSPGGSFDEEKAHAREERADGR